MSFLSDSNVVVLIGFLLFVGLLIYLKVPGMITKMLDERADKIRADIDEARALREEAQTLLASYERKQAEVQAQADAIVAKARQEAKAEAARAQEDLKTSVERRLAAANAQIASAEEAAVKEVKNKAVSVAITAAQTVIGKNMTAKDGGSLIDSAIKEVGEKLH